MTEKICLLPYLDRLDTAYAAGGPGFSAVPGLVDDYSRRLAMIPTRPETRKLRELVTGPVGLYAIAFYELARTQMAILPSTQRIAEFTIHKVMNGITFYYTNDPELPKELKGKKQVEMPKEHADALRRKVLDAVKKETGRQQLRKNIEDAGGDPDEVTGGYTQEELDQMIEDYRRQQGE